MMTNPKPLTPPVRKPYRTPVGQFIPRTKETAELYRIEQRRNEAIMLAAVELGKVLKLDDRWREVMPEALLNILENYDRRAAYLAARTFCDRHPELAAEIEREPKFVADGEPKCAHAAVIIGRQGFGIGLVTENESSYSRMTQYGAYETHEEAAAIAERLNQKAGISADDAARIIASSMKAQNRARGACRP